MTKMVGCKRKEQTDIMNVEIHIEKETVLHLHLFCLHDHFIFAIHSSIFSFVVDMCLTSNSLLSNFLLLQRCYLRLMAPLNSKLYFYERYESVHMLMMLL
jgi:hypothetical protein